MREDAKDELLPIYFKGRPWPSAKSKWKVFGCQRLSEETNAHRELVTTPTHPKHARVGLTRTPTAPTAP